MECDFLDWNCSIAHRRSGALRELTHEPLAINNAEAPVQSAVRDGGTLVAASYRYRADPNEIGKMPAHVHVLPIKTKMFYAFSVRSSRSGYESDSMMLQRVQSI